MSSRPYLKARLTGPVSPTQGALPRYSILHTPYSILAAHRARSLRLDDALFADAGKQHAVVAVGGLEGAHEFTNTGAVL